MYVSGCSWLEYHVMLILCMKPLIKKTAMCPRFGFFDEKKDREYLLQAHEAAKEALRGVRRQYKMPQ